MSNASYGIDPLPVKAWGFVVLDDESPRYVFRGFEGPSYTPVPDIVFDELAPELTEAELRVLLYIVRRTFGFKRQADAISLSQLVSGITTRDGRVLDRGTGMSRPGVTKGIKGLAEKKIIIVEKGTDERGENQVNVYRLRFRDEVGNEVTPPTKPRYLPVGNEVALGVGNEVYPQETDVQQTVNKNVPDEKKNDETKIPLSRKAESDDAQPPPVTDLDRYREMPLEERLAEFEATQSTLKRLPRLS